MIDPSEFKKHTEGVKQRAEALVEDLWPGKRVLVVEDNESIKAILKAHFKRVGLSAYPVKDYAHLEMIVRVSEPDAIVLDVGGIPDFEKIAGMFPERTVIFSAYAINGNIPQKIKEKVHAVVDKTQFKKLVEVVTELCTC